MNVHADSIIRARSFLLQEKTPRQPDPSPPGGDPTDGLPKPDELAAEPRRFTTPHQAVPRAHLLSNGGLLGDGDQRRLGLQPMA